MSGGVVNKVPRTWNAAKAKGWDYDKWEREFNKKLHNEMFGDVKPSNKNKTKSTLRYTELEEVENIEGMAIERSLQELAESYAFEKNGNVGDYIKGEYCLAIFEGDIELSKLDENNEYQLVAKKFGAADKYLMGLETPKEVKKEPKTKKKANPKNIIDTIIKAYTRKGSYLLETIEYYDLVVTKEVHTEVKKALKEKEVLKVEMSPENNKDCLEFVRIIK